VSTLRGALGGPNHLLLVGLSVGLLGVVIPTMIGLGVSDFWCCIDFILGILMNNLNPTSIGTIVGLSSGME